MVCFCVLQEVAKTTNKKKSRLVTLITGGLFVEQVSAWIYQYRHWRRLADHGACQACKKYCWFSRQYSY